MRQVGRVQNGDYLLQLTEFEFQALLALAHVVGGRARLEFVNPRGHLPELDYTPLFRLLEDFISARMYVNQMEHCLERLKEHLNSKEFHEAFNIDADKMIWVLPDGTTTKDGDLYRRTLANFDAASRSHPGKSYQEVLSMVLPDVQVDKESFLRP